MRQAPVRWLQIRFRLGAAINPVHHMGTVNNDSLINCEKWADSDRLNWYENEIPKTVAAGAVVIGSVGHTLKEAQAIVQDVERAGATSLSWFPTQRIPCFLCLTTPKSM